MTYSTGKGFTEKISNLEMQLIVTNLSKVASWERSDDDSQYISSWCLFGGTFSHQCASRNSKISDKNWENCLAWHLEEGLGRGKAYRQADFAFVRRATVPLGAGNLVTG